MIKTEILLDFIDNNTGKPLSSPRALFGTGGEELFGIAKSSRDKGKAVLRTEAGEEFEISIHTAEQIIELIFKNPVVALDKSDDAEIPAYLIEAAIEEDTEVHDENIQQKLQYICDLIVLSGIASYGWAKTPSGNKFRAVAIRRKKINISSEKSGYNQHNISKSLEEAEAGRFPTQNQKKPAEKNLTSDEKKGDKDKDKPAILITYTTKHGSTADIAWTISNSFFDSGYKADVKKIQDVEDLRQYSLVVIGAPVYEGRLMPEAEEFVKLHRNYLNKKNVALFITGYSFRDNDYEEVQKAEKLAAKISQYADIVTTGYFGGKLDAGNIPIKEKIGSLFREARVPGDYRDWRLIGEWADGLKKYI